MSRLDEYFAKANRGSQTTSSVSASGEKPASNMDAYFAKAGKPVRTNPLNLYTEALKGSQGQSTMQTPYADAAAQTKQSGTQNLYAQAAENAKKSGTNNSFLHGIAGIFEKAAAGAKEGLRTGLNEMGYRAQAEAPLNAADDAYYKAMWEQTTGQKTGVEVPKDTRTQQQKELDEFMGVADLYSDSARAMQRAADKEYERLDNEGLSTAFKRDGTYQAKVDERYADLGPKWQRAMNIAGSVGNQALPIIGRIAGTALLGEKGGEAFQSFLFFNQASGAAIEEALEDGASWDKALTYGTVIGSIEAATEAAGDMANKVTIKAAGKYLPKEQFTKALIGTLTGNKTMRTALTILGQMHGEGLEEVASDLVSPFAKSIYNGKTLGENWMNDVTLQGLWESYLAGAISGGFLSGIGGAVNGQFRAQNESYANETVNAKIEEARASMKENGLFNSETRGKIIDAGAELGALEAQQQTAAKEAREHMQMIREMQRALRGDAGAQERISRMQEGNYTAGVQNAPAGAQRAQNEGIYTTPTAAINIQEGMNNGQSTYHREESGDAYVGSRGQAAEGAEGGLQALTGGRTEVQRGVGTDAQADLRQVTPAQLGIRDGGTEAVTVVDAQRLGGEAKSAYDAVLENGLEPVAVRGAIQVGDGYANAYTESGKVFFRVDAMDSRGNAISPEMLVQHELFHNYASEEVIRATDEVIRESMTAEEYDAMREAYKADYAGVYDFANMSVDEIERLLTEEIAADAYAGLNWFSGDAPVQEAVRAETERNAPARRAEAQQETTGPPGRATAAGISARTADSTALRRAEALEKSGTDNETIRQETGWYRGMDGQWRFEIDDSGATFSRTGEAQYSADNADYARYTQLMNRMLTGDLTEAEHAELLGLDKKNGSTKKELARRIDEGNATLRDILQHNALFDAYPEIAETKVKFADMPSGTAGSYNRETNTITLDTKLKYDANDALDALMHEVQHRVQAAEGFASGTNPGYWNRGENYDRAAEKYRDNRARLLNGLSTEDLALYNEYRSAEREMGAMLDGSMLYDESRMDALEKRSDELYRELYGKEWFGKLNRYDRILGDAGEAVKEFYRSTAGEIEARDTTSRRRMTAEERKNTPPDLGDADTVFADGNTMAAYAEANGNIRRNNIEYADNAARNAAQKALHDRMVSEGKTLDLTENREAASQYFPNLRSMPKAERTAILRERIQTLKNDLRTYLNQLKGVNFEFEINGNTIEATVYNAGVKEVLQNLTQDKAGMLSASEEIFRNAEYLYSTQDKTGSPNVTGWDYFYVPVKIGGDTVGVRIAIRNMAFPTESQIYNWGIKREDTSLDGVGLMPGGRTSADVSSDVSSTATIRQTEGNSQEKSSGKASVEVPEINNHTAAELRREYDRRTREYQRATQRDDQSFPYIDEMKWMQAAERRLAELGDGKRKRRTVGNTKRDIMKLFFTDTANRVDVEQMLNRNIGEMMARGEIRGDALDTIVDEMLQAGSVVSNSENSPWIDETHEDIRSDLRGTKLYVSEQTWRDFRKDEARMLREQAHEAGITLSKNQNDTAADVRNMELAEKYGEALFPTDISAPDMLRNIVDRAAKGVSEKQTLADRLWDEARLEGAGRDQQEAYDRMVGALRDQTEVILREFAEDNHLTLREQTKQGSGNETGTKSETEQRRERLQALAEQDRREAERLRARENLGAGQRFVPNKSSGEIYRELMGKGKSEVKVQMTGFLKGTPKESTFKVEVKPTPIGGYYEATIFRDGHKADTLVRALKETAARDAAEEVITMANRNFSEENYQRAKKFEAEKTADEDARIAELFGDPEQLDSTETSPKSSDAAETENTAAGATIDATTEKVTSEVIKAERNFREDFEKITSGAMRMFVNAGDTVRRIAKATGSKSLEGYYFNAGAYSQRAGNWIAKGGARTDIDGHRIGASLADTLAPMRKNETKYRDFQLYLLHMHNVDRMKYDNSGELERIKENLRWVKEKYPELRELSNEELRRIANSDSDSPVVRQAAHEIYLAAHNGEAPSLTSVAEGAAYALELERQRAIVEKQGLKPVFGYDVTADDSQTAAQLLEAKNPEFKEWAKEVYRYSDDLIRYRVEAGLITPEFANALKKRYPHYIPTFREEGTNSKRARRARRNGGIVVSNAIGRAVGSDGVLLPLHTALSRKTVSTMRNAGLNQFGLALVREYDRNAKAAEKYIWNVAESEYTPTEAAIESDEDYKPVFENVFSVKDNGRAYDITMDEGLTAAMKAFEPDKFASYGAAKAMKKLNDLFKALCTGYNPFFMIRNGVRDWQDAGFYSTDWKTWERMYWSAWNQIRKNGEIWQQYKALGGSYASMLDYTTGMVKEPKNALGKAAAWYESLGQAIEAAPRLAEFMTILANKGGSKTVDGVKTGKFTQSDLMEAMLGAADITTNFARGGSVTKALNRYLVPFINPSVQGFDKFIRNATETRSVKAAGSLILKAALMGIAPALLNALAYRDDDEWDDIPANTKANYYLINFGNGIWLKIPKGRAIAVLSTAAVYGKEKLDGEDVKFSDVFEVIKSNIAPTDIFNQNIATAWTQAKLTNPDNPGTTWYGGNIESDRLQNYRPEDRYDEKTDELSKAIGKLFKVSPKKINYLLNQYSGVIGDILLPLITPATKSSHWLLAAPQAAFTIDTTSTNKTTGKYYDLLDDLKYDANDGDIGAGITRKYVSHAGDEVNDYYQQIRAIQNDKSLSDGEKNRIVRALKAQLIERQKEIIAQAEPYREAVNDYLKAHPELSTDNDAAIAEYAERYEITEDQAESRMDAIVYREANREVFGAEYALRTYNADVYDKARAAYAKGVSYDTYYDYYFATKEMHADKDENGKSISGSKKAKVVEYINSLDIPPEQKDALYVAAGYTAKSARNQKWNGGSGGSGGRRGRGKRTALKAPTPKAPEIIIQKSGTASSAKAGGTSKTPKVSGNVIADFTKTASGTDIQKAVTQAKRKALKAGNRTVYVEEGSPIDYFLKYGKLPSLK